MKRNIFLILGLAAGLGLTACSGNGNSNNTPATETADTHTAQNSLDWSGTYTGILPCADCEGLKTTIILHSDNTYTSETEYLGKNVKFSESGTIEWSEDGRNITLIPTDGGKQSFQVNEGRIVLLNADGKPNTGELADAYILKKL